MEGSEPEPDDVDMAGEIFDDYVFDEDGGEIICTLPNGLNVYYLAAASGEGLDEGPTDIVLHEENAEDGAAVVNGISCFYCHYEGQIFKPDEIRDHWETNEGAFGYPAGIAELVEETYIAADEFEALQEEDRARFLAAIADMGAPTSIDANGEPVWALGQDFREDMDLERVLGELGLTQAEFEQHLDDATDPEVLRVFGGMLTDGAVLAREEFLETASLAACDFGIADNSQCAADDPCGESGISCLDDQRCVTSADDPAAEGACVTSCDFDRDEDGIVDIECAGADCDDDDPAVGPHATEVCDGIDNDCDGRTDPDDSADASTWYLDDDGDGFGDEASPALACDHRGGRRCRRDDGVPGRSLVARTPQTRTSPSRHTPGANSPNS